MRRLVLRSLLVPLFLGLLAPDVRAQSPAPTTIGPAAGLSRAGVERPAPAPIAEWGAARAGAEAPAVAVQGGPTGREKGLMIVGGIALVAGAVVGGTAGTLVSLGGAAVALYGLYLFASR